MADDPFFKQWQLNRLREVSSYVGADQLSAQDIREAWMRASHAADPSGEVTYAISDQLLNAQTAEQALVDLEGAASKNSSIYTRRAMSIFLEDVGAMSSALASGQKITTSAIPNMRLPSLATSGLGRVNLSAQMQADLARIEKMFGARATVLQRSRQGLGSELVIQFAGGSLPTETYMYQGKEYTKPLELKIARVDPLNPNLVQSGATQQSRYLAGRYDLLTAEGMLERSFNHEEWVLNRAAAEVFPEFSKQRNLSFKEMQSRLRAFSTESTDLLEWVPSLSPDSHTGLDKYIEARSNIRRFFTVDPNTQQRVPINEFQYARLMEKGLMTPEGYIPLFPGASPTQIAHNVAYTKDVSDIFHLIPGSVDWGRRPLKALRREYMPSTTARAWMSQDPRNRMFSWMAAEGAVEAPMLRLGYVSSRYEQQLSKYGLSEEGQFLLSEMSSIGRGVAKLEELKIAQMSPQLSSLIDLEQGDRWDINQKLKRGTFLGYDPTGSPVTLSSDMTVLEAASFRDKNQGDFIRVSALNETGPRMFGKYEGPVKGMGAQVPVGHMVEALQSAGIRGVGSMGPLQGLISMNELKKNRALHYNQLFSSLWEFTSINMDSGKTTSTLSSNFANDPRKVLAAINQAAIKNGEFRHEVALLEAFKLARASKLTPSQMGEVFGAVPDVFGMSTESSSELRNTWIRTMMQASGRSDEQIDSILSGQGNAFAKGYWSRQRGFALSFAEAEAIRRGVATGTGQLFFVGPGGSGAGGLGTMEPRLFEMMGTIEGLGPEHLGGQIQNEFEARMRKYYPERVLEESELTKSLKSLYEPGGNEGFLPSRIAKEGLPIGGGYMNLPEVGDVYIPSTDRLQSLASYKTAAGKEITPDLAKAYLGTAEAAEAFQAGKLSGAEYRKVVEGLQGEVMRARTLSVFGKGGLLRTKVPGSVSLTTVLPTAGIAPQDPKAIGITRRYAEKMFEGMEQVYGSDAAGALRKRFFAGESIAGLAARQPITGPYSMQIARYQLVAGDDAVAVVGRQAKKAQALVRGKWEAINNPISLSVMPGMRMDVDGDTMSAFLVSPQLEKTLSTVAMDQNAIDEYERYAIRSQLVKPRVASKEAVTIQSLLQSKAGAAYKLGVTERGRLGRLSVQLQQARSGIIMGLGGNLSRQEKSNALGMLEWLENVPIQSKHTAPGQEQELLFTLDTLSEAMQKKQSGMMIDEVERVMKGADPLAQSLLRGGTDFAYQTEEGLVKQQFIPGMDYRNSVRHIMAAQQAAETADIGGVSAARLGQLRRGARPTATEARSILGTGITEGAFSGMFSIADLPAAKEGAGFSKRMLALQNKIAAAGESAIARYKPLLIGGMAAVGIAAALSQPSKMTPPGSAVPPANINLRSGSGGAKMDTNVHPSSHVQGSPTPPDILEGANTARIAGPGSFAIDIHGTSGGGVAYNELSDQIRRGIGGGNVRTSISDRRSSLTSQKISDILQNS